MALNIKNPQVERLAAEVSRMTHESKTEAIRKALEERKARLAAGQSQPSVEEMITYFRRRVWSKIPADTRGKPMSKEEEEEILGYGPNGV